MLTKEAFCQAGPYCVNTKEMQKQAMSLEGWTWDMQEQSNGVYWVRLTSMYGLKVEKVGTDEDELFRWCLDAARAIDQQLSLKSEQ